MHSFNCLSLLLNKYAGNCLSSQDQVCLFVSRYVVILLHFNETMRNAKYFVFTI